MGSASRIHQHTAPKRGPPLEFINIQPQNGGSASRIHQHQPKNGGPPLGTISMDLAVHVVHWTNRDSSLQDSYAMTLVVYNARRQVFVQECAYLFLIAALRQKQNIALHLLLVFLKMGSIYHSFSFFSKVIPKIYI